MQIAELEKVKKKLKQYKRENIEFNEPHFSERLALREGNKEQVISFLRKPDNLVYFYTERGRYGDVIHNLYFKVSNTRTMKLPVIFDKNQRKYLYILTYILRYRSWQGMVKKWEK